MQMQLRMWPPWLKPHHHSQDLEHLGHYSKASSFPADSSQPGSSQPGSSKPGSSKLDSSKPDSSYSSKLDSPSLGSSLHRTSKSMAWPWEKLELGPANGSLVAVNDIYFCYMMQDMFEETRRILEPAGALSLAGAKAYCQYYGIKDEAMVAITSGANMNFDRLRVVTELADVGARKEAVLATFMPEEPGSFKKFQQMVGPVSITEFKYRYTSDQEALVLYSVGLHKDEELSALKDRMEGAGMRTMDLTNNDLAKDHLRHLMGGRTHVEHELLYRFVFPERQGALMKFLDAFSPSWNITLFHYRSQGEMGANVLVALQIEKEDEQEFIDRANALGYEFQDECNNEAFQLILR